MSDSQPRQSILSVKSDSTAKAVIDLAHGKAQSGNGNKGGSGIPPPVPRSVRSAPVNPAEIKARSLDFSQETIAATQAAQIKATSLHKEALSRERIQAQQAQAEAQSKATALKKKAEAEALKIKKSDKLKKDKHRDKLKIPSPIPDTRISKKKKDKKRYRSEDSDLSLRTQSHKKSKPSRSEELDSRLDPTLDINGRPARRIITPPSAQSLDLTNDPHYPALSLKTAKIRLIQQELLQLIKTREDFDKFPEDSLIDTSAYLFDSGLNSLDELKKCRPVNRTFILEDLRHQGRSARELDFLLSLFHTFPAPVRNPNNKKSLQEELRIPTLMKDFPAQLSGLSTLLAPDQAMVNDITRQLNEGESCVPRFYPFATAQLHSDPWRSPLPAHDRVVDDWADRMKALKSAQPLPFQAYLFYQIRFILAGHLCAAWGHFGGLSAQMNAIAITLNLSVIENSGVAISYDMLMRKHIAQLARQRHTDVDFASLLSKENEDIKKQVLAQRAIAHKTKDSKDDGKKQLKGNKGKGKNGYTKKPWEKKKPWGQRNQDTWIVRPTEPRPDTNYGPPDRAQDHQGNKQDQRRSEGRSRSARCSNQEQASSSTKKKTKK